MKQFFLGLLFSLIITLSTHAQKGAFSGSFQNNNNFFMRDTAIGAAGTPQYDNQLSGSEAWLNLYYRNSGFDLGLRFDLFNNSNLRDPLQSFTGQGIGMWYIRKKIQKLDITAGYIYDQIGSGAIFRAFEERPLAIDNALVGARLIYEINQDWQAKIFTGKQKNYFDLYGPVIKGGSIEGFWRPNDTSALTLSPGIGIVNRTLDNESMALIVNNIESQPPAQRFVPTFNTFAFTFYNQLSYKGLSWFIEAAYKTKEAVNIPEVGFIDSDGYVLSSNLSYAVKGLSGTVTARRAKYFDLRTSPNETLNRGLITFLPPLTRQNTYTLTARYNANIQLLGEQALMLDLTYSPSRKESYSLNISNIQDLNGTLLYREFYGDATFKGKKNKWQLTSGLQLQQYNQEIYEEKPNVPLVETIIPFTEFTYRINRKNSIRAEAQYMVTDEDFGQWAFALIEYNISPSWSFSVSDMINTVPKKDDRIIHYPVVFVAYTKSSNRFTASYVKQVEGVVCTGGVCRFEPAFSGFKLTVNSTF